MNLSNTLYELRRERKLSQEDLAGIIGVSRQAVQKWESGAAVPDLENLVALSRYFGVTLDELVRGSGDHPVPADTPSDTAPAERVVYVESRRYQYKSKNTLFGLPLVHVNLGRGLCVARGVIAIGNVAVGAIALGGVSLGLLSFGGLALGLVALAGISLGVLSMGGIAVGVLALGGMAVGVYAVGGLAVASQIAVGGLATAPIAIGGEAYGSFALYWKEAVGRPITAAEIREIIPRLLPFTPRFIIELFALLAGS